MLGLCPACPRKEVRAQLAARMAYEERLWALLACTQQDAVAACLIEDGVALLDGHDADAPLCTEVLLDALRPG